MDVRHRAPRAAAFQHRAIATTLAEITERHGTAILTGIRSTLLCGMGGVGKTQLAADHAHQLWDAGELDVLM
ncbi:hypothetical protein [Crossiella sp. NPDC003009]